MSLMRFLLSLSAWLLLCVAANAHPIEKGVAITDSEAMQELETNGFAFSALMSPDWRRGAATPVLNNAELARVAPIAAETWSCPTARSVGIGPSGITGHPARRMRRANLEIELGAA